MWDTQLFVRDNRVLKTFVHREVKLKGISTPRGSLQMGGVKKEAGELTEVTCDKVSLTKNEYVPVCICFSSSSDNNVITIFKMLT